MHGAWRQTRTPFDHHTGDNHPAAPVRAGPLRHLRNASEGHFGGSGTWRARTPVASVDPVSAAKSYQNQWFVRSRRPLMQPDELFGLAIIQCPPYPSRSRRRIASRFWCSVSFGLRPSLTPRALARSRPSLVRARRGCFLPSGRRRHTPLRGSKLRAESHSGRMFRFPEPALCYRR